MTGVLIGGAVAGLGVLVLVLVLLPPRVQPGSALARLDVRRADRRRAATAAPTAGPAWTEPMGRRVAALASDLGFGMANLRSDLALMGRGLEQHLAQSLVVGLVALVAPVLVSAVLVLGGVGSAVSVPALGGVVLAVLAAATPTLVLRSRAARRRRDFRHVVGSFLDLVAMSLAGGRGVPEALQSASELSDDWAMVRIRDTLGAARLRGATPWSALGELGAEVRVDELRDLAAALALVAEDGAKVRESLGARAGSMRRRELAEAEGRAGERSQSMLVAQLLLAVGFLVFLVYPAMVTVLRGG